MLAPGATAATAGEHLVGISAHEDGDRLCKTDWISGKIFDVTPFVGPGLMRVGGCGHAAAPC